MAQMAHNGMLRKIFFVLGLFGMVGFGLMRGLLPDSMWKDFPLLSRSSHPLIGLAAFLLIGSVVLLIAAYFLPDGKKNADPSEYPDNPQN